VKTEKTGLSCDSTVKRIEKAIILRLRTKMNLLFSAIIIIIGTTLGYSIYVASIDLIVESIGIKAKNIVENVANNIDMDELQKVTERTLQIEEEKGDVQEILDMPEYQKLRQQLWDFKKFYRMKFLYIMTKTKEGETIYVIDAFPLDYKGNDISLPGEVEFNTYEYLEAAIDEGQAFIGELTKDRRWGANLASYVPLTISEGDTIGVLGIDIEAEDIYELMAQTRKNIGLFTAVAVIVVLFISWLTIGVVTRRLRKLTSKVQKVREGDYSVEFDTNEMDEIGELEVAFDELVGVFNDSNIRINNSLIDLSKSHKVEELDQKIISNIKNALSIESVDILEFDRENINSHKTKLNLPYPYIQKYLRENVKCLKIGNLVKINEGFLTLVGIVEDRYRILFVDGQNVSLSQRDKLSIKLLSRYIAVFYENLTLIEELSNKIMDFQNGGDAPSWMSKVFLQISEKERKRLASDLHDEILQSIIKMRRDVSNFLENRSVGKDDVLNQLARMGEEFDEVILMIRETCNELLPSFLSEKGIVRAIDRLIERVSLKTNIVFSFEAFNVDSKLEYEEVLTVYRVVQELINNAMAHSKASEVELMLRQGMEKFVIYYIDNGVGMDLDAKIDTNKHLGLNGIKERIRLLNGSVSISSELGKGLEFSCQFPTKKIIAC
jgi:signal transduction histidine kinase